MNTFYLNTIETLVFEPTTQTSLDVVGQLKPDSRLSDVILRAVVDGRVLYESMPYPILPPYRSLLIQLLFRNHNEMVSQYLKTWFTKGTADLSSIFKSAKDMAIFFQGCIQDLYVNQTRQVGTNELEVASSIAADLIKPSIKGFLNEIMNSQEDVFGVDELEYIAKLKFVIKILAKLVNSQESVDAAMGLNKKMFEKFCENMKSLIEPTATLTPTVFNYLVKELVRKFSYSSVKYIMASANIKWIGNLPYICVRV